MVRLKKYNRVDEPGPANQSHCLRHSAGMTTLSAMEYPHLAADGGRCRLGGVRIYRARISPKQERSAQGALGLLLWSWQPSVEQMFVSSPCFLLFAVSCVGLRCQFRFGGKPINRILHVFYDLKYRAFSQYRCLVIMRKNRDAYAEQFLRK